MSKKDKYFDMSYYQSYTEKDYPSKIKKGLSNSTNFGNTTLTDSVIIADTELARENPLTLSDLSEFLEELGDLLYKYDIIALSKANIAYNYDINKVSMTDSLIIVKKG